MSAHVVKVAKALHRATSPHWRRLIFLRAALGLGLAPNTKSLLRTSKSFFSKSHAARLRRLSDGPMEWREGRASTLANATEHGRRNDRQSAILPPTVSVIDSGGTACRRVRQAHPTATLSGRGDASSISRKTAQHGAPGKNPRSTAFVPLRDQRRWPLPPNRYFAPSTSRPPK